MAELPKIALERLRAKNRPPIATDGPPASGDATHPDANLLAAFAERTLSERERIEVLTHLTECRDCRDIAALIVPAGEMAEPASVTPVQRWNPWRFIRWSTVAAALGAVTIAVVLHPELWRRNSAALNSQPPVLSAANTAKPQSLPPSPAAPTPTEDAKSAPAKGTPKAVEPLGEVDRREVDRLKKSEGARLDVDADKRANRLQARKQSTVMASSQPSVTLRAMNIPQQERKETLGDYAASGAARSAPVAASPPSAATAQAPPAGLGGAGKASADTEKARVKDETVVAQNETRQLEATSRMGMAIGGLHGSLKSKNDQLATAWSISPEGKVQRAPGLRPKTLQAFDVAPGVKFQAVAASGDDVWAGGEGGVLYHSADAGANWTQVAIEAKGAAMKETITAIEIHDAKHLTIATTSGAEWTSKDGGKHWKRQP